VAAVTPSRYRLATCLGKHCTRSVAKVAENAEREPAREPVLSIRDLTVDFVTDDGIVQAVNGMRDRRL
jgi:hypothetical protein